MAGICPERVFRKEYSITIRQLVLSFQLGPCVDDKDNVC